jgi:hypothetical protein
MKEIIFYILFGFACLVIIAFCNKDFDNRCQNKNGQIIVSNSKLGHSCIYTAK